MPSDLGERVSVGASVAGLVLYYPTWGLSGVLVVIGSILAVAALLVSPRGRAAWVAVCANAMCWLLVFVLSGGWF